MYSETQSITAKTDKNSAKIKYDSKNRTKLLVCHIVGIYEHKKGIIKKR